MTEELTASVGTLADNMISIRREAVELSDTMMIDKVIEPIRDKDTSLTEALSKPAGNFACDNILDLIRKQ